MEQSWILKKIIVIDELVFQETIRYFNSHTSADAQIRICPPEIYNTHTHTHTTISMQTLAPSDVTNALSLLAKTASVHRNAIANYNAEPACPDCNWKSNSWCLVFDKFYYDGGPGAVVDMNYPAHTNWSTFTGVWRLEDKVRRRIMLWKKEKVASQAKRSPFILLSVLKNCWKPLCFRENTQLQRT